MKIITDTHLTFDLYGPAFAAIALFRSTVPERPYLHGVRVEPLAEGGALLIATDAHKLAVYRDETATAKSKVTLKINKTVTGREEFYFCEEGLDDYAPWRKVIPPASTPMETTGSMGLNAKHLNAFAKAAKTLGQVSSLKVALFKDYKKQECHLVENCDPNFYGLLMACEIPDDYAPKFRPAFLDAEPAEPEQEAGE